MKNKASNPDAETISMLTDGLLLQDTWGGGRVEDPWNPPAPQMQQILQTQDNEIYDLYSEIKYANRHYVYRNHKQQYFINCEGVGGLENNTNRQRYKPYIVLRKRIE